ncbi:AAA family ATPase [Arthrobacter sp. Alg241-R88]|uniref:AAA family ATPase n=1 Tax=Arthrobacter sp. Alg241-R88 TaxID=2305984 RepID=UPI0013D0248A|nr:AAA family ATPase [Arthrobacter sp. Alg241-R88]
MAGRPWAELADDELPPCHLERAGFMSPVPRRIVKAHPYSDWNDVYRKFEPVSLDLPAYSADCVPFRWMLRENADSLSQTHGLAYEHRLEEEIDREAKLKDPAWIQHEQNQRAMLDAFFSAVEPGASLVFIYAKDTPLSDDPRRVLVGVGRVTGKSRSRPYGNRGSGFGSVTWETPIQHSIRPTMEDGFLLPYHQLLELAEDRDLDPGDYVVMVPEELTSQFSYATEHVSHDAALSLLLLLTESVEKFSAVVPGDWDRVRAWLSERIAEAWEARGAFPGLGSALTAFGITQGVLLAYAIRGMTSNTDDNPWDVVDRIFRNPSDFPDLRPKPGPMLCKTWAALKQPRRELLTLISRFDFTIEQATRMFVETERIKAGVEVSDDELIENPYRFFEADRFRPDPTALPIIDRGVFPIETLRNSFPLPVRSRIDDALDERRVRAICVGLLERAAQEGHSLMSQNKLVQAVRDEPLDPPCPLTNDIIAVAEGKFAAEIQQASMADGQPAYQLLRLHHARDRISTLVRKRMKAKPLPVTANWEDVIGALLRTSALDDPDESQARIEKAAALETLAQSRLSVLVGPAGTGKTTLLRALCSLPQVAEEGVLLLAPTGKARVRMQSAIGIPAQTLAQLLVPSGRYSPDTGRYQRSDEPRRSGFSTVIVDECSMLTEEQLDALLDGLEGHKRLILVGDPRQLPPIGVGRPFVDIVEHIRAEGGVAGFPLVGPSIAELTVRRRQLFTGAANSERPDLVLADWFSGVGVPPGADSVWDELNRHSDLGTLAVRQWSTSAQLHQLLKTELAASLEQMSDCDDQLGFQASYGGNVSGQHVYFNRGSAGLVEAWQILSPVRSVVGGVNELNRLIQHTYRASMRNLAQEPVVWKRKIPKPVGPQEIVYGDKVINVRNKARTRFWPENDDALAYVANGEIGVVVGPFKKIGSKISLNQWEVEFSTQPGVAYKFWRSELGDDEGSPFLELAYALTVHKSQGSEFGTTFVVIPSPCRLLTRELLYTALTRHQNRVVLLLQGDLSELRGYSSPKYSQTAARLTNLFSNPNVVEIDGRFMEKGLIHRARNGVHVRSKSEVIIADLLYSKGIGFTYEQELTRDGTTRLPDFTIEDPDTGDTYYWEHLGMLNNSSYKRKWEKKREWYISHGIHTRGLGAEEDPDGKLIVTTDGPDGSISSAFIEDLIDDIFDL